MKKTYVKPQLWKEAFQPADAIAGSCDIDVGFGDGGNGAGNTCGYISEEYGGLKLFNDIGNVCEAQYDKGTDPGCYHVPMTGANYFGS